MKRAKRVLYGMFSLSISLLSLPRPGLANRLPGDRLPPRDPFSLMGQRNTTGYSAGFSLDQASREETGRPQGKKPKKHLGRATLECLALFAYSQTKYWVTYGDWIEDWHYDLTWEDQKKRFFSFEAWKFDSNCFGLNWSHALSGALYFDIARTNNLNRLESLLFTIGGSFYWEYIAEWRNVISIGDNIFTIFGGASIGEAWYQLGKYFTNRNGLGHRIFSFINPVLKFNNWLDRKEMAGWPREPEPGWRKFHFFMGGGLFQGAAGKDTPAAIQVGAHSQILHIPEFGKPGQISQQRGDTLLSELSFDFYAGKRGVEEVNFFSRTVFFGYLKQNIDSQQRGYAYYVGLGSAFDYSKKRSLAFYDGCKVKVRRGYDLHLEEPREFTDKFSAVHIAGPVFDLTSVASHFRWRLVLDAYLDFALINAFALNAYSADHDISGIKTNLLYYGYYYGAGTTLGSGFSVIFHNLEFNGLLRFHGWGSIDGRDRFQDELTDDFHVRDSRLQLKLELGYRIPGTPIAFYASYESIERRGIIKEIDHKVLHKRMFLGLKFWL